MWDDVKYILLTLVLIIVVIVLRKANGDCNLGEPEESRKEKEEQLN